MSALRGVVIGVVALSALDAVVSSPAGARNAGGAIELAANVFRRLVDPSVPLVPDLRDGSSSASSSSPKSATSTRAPAPPAQRTAGATKPPGGVGHSAA